MTFRLTSGLTEIDLQREILLSLGVEQFETKVDKTGKPRRRSKNLFLGVGCMFWRANSGFVRGGSGRPIQVNSPGCADILGTVRGRPIALEVKTEIGRQSKEQRDWQSAWEAAGGVYAIVRSVGEARAVVDNIRQAA